MATYLEQGRGRGPRLSFDCARGEGALRWVENRYVPVRDKEGRLIEVEGIVIDITERKAAEEKITLLARTDALTGLANRATFTERLSQAFAAAQRGALRLRFTISIWISSSPSMTRSATRSGICCCNRWPQRLKSCTRESDLVARLGGDEFAILQGEMKEPANAGTAGREDPNRAGPALLDQRQRGRTFRSASGSAPTCRILRARMRCWCRRIWRCIAPRRRAATSIISIRTISTAKCSIASRSAAKSKRAIEQNEFELQYQPQVELSSQNIVGMEALIRWNHPTRGLLAPGLFIPDCREDRHHCRARALGARSGLPANEPLAQREAALVRHRGQSLAYFNSRVGRSWCATSPRRSPSGALRPRISNLTSPRQPWPSSPGRKTRFSRSCASSA